MKELNELIDRYDVSCHCGAVYVRPKQDGHLVMYSDYASLAQRAEAAEAALAEEKRINSKLREDRAGLARECNTFEAKLKELEKQKPVGTVSISMDWNTHRNIATVNMRPDLVVAEMKNGDELFTRPAPAVSLAELVPEDYFASLVSKARNSADKAITKFPQPNYVLLKVAEEAGEVVQAGVHYAENRMTWQEVESEVVQLMAMLIRLVTEGDQVNGITPPEACRAAILRNIEEQSQ